MPETMEEKRQQMRVDKLVSSQESLVKSVNKLVKVQGGDTPTQTQRDKFKVKEDISTELLKQNRILLGNILSTNKENLKINVKAAKSKSKNLFGMIGSVLALGGLAGFLFTGDSKYLRPLVKKLGTFGIKAATTIYDFAKPKLLKLGGFIWDTVKSPFVKFGGWVKTMWDDMLFGLKGMWDNVAKSMTGLWDNVLAKLDIFKSKFIGFFDNILTKLSKIPGFGFLKKGLGEAAETGVKKVAGEVVEKGVKVAGGELAEKGAIKLLPKIAKKGAKGILKKGAKTGAKKGLGFALKQIPVIGGAVNAVFAIDRLMKGDYKGAGLELAAGGAGLLDLVVPGVGSALSTTIELGIMGRDIAREFTDKENLKQERARGGLFSKIGQVVKSISGGPGDAMMPPIATPPLKPKAISGFAAGLKEKLEVAKDKSTAAIKKATNVLGLRLFNKQVDPSGVNPDVWHNFTGMVQEYYNKTGNMVQLNSAYRDYKKQLELYRSSPAGTVARPGLSMHNYGYALDVNSKEANEMENLGLMRKWGFHQPGVKYGWKNPEPWHVEPKNIDRVAIRQQGLVSPTEEGNNPSQIGDIPMGNLSQSLNNGMSRRVPPSTPSGMPIIQLSDDTISKLAVKIMEEGKQNVPTMISKSSIQVDARG